MHETEGVQLWDIRTHKLLRQADWTNGTHKEKDLSSIYSLKFVRPEKQVVLACGIKRNCAKLISVSTGEVVHDFTATHPELETHPLTVVDNAPNGCLSLIGSSNGNVYLKKILIRGDDEDSSDSDS